MAFCSPSHHKPTQLGVSDFFSECAYPPLPQDRSERTSWLKPDTPSDDALKHVVLDGHFKTLDRITGFNYTGNLEVYHLVLLKYCEKWSHFSYEGMIAGQIYKLQQKAYKS